MCTKNKRPCVLIVDDDYYFSTDVLGYHLKKLNFEVIQAYTVSDFERSWQSADVIVLDIRLPEKEGDPIDPWAGLKALVRILAKVLCKTHYPQLENCIIRSAQTKADAIGARIKIPDHYAEWFSPDIPFSEIIKAVQKVSKDNQKMEK